MRWGGGRRAPVRRVSLTAPRRAANLAGSHPAWPAQRFPLPPNGLHLPSARRPSPAARPAARLAAAALAAASGLLAGDSADAQQPTPLAGAAAPAPRDTGTAVRGQIFGAGDDATLPRAGELRVRAQPRFTGWSEVYGAPGVVNGTTRRGTGARLTLDTLGPAQIEALRPAAAALRTITGDPATPLSLGRLQSAARGSSFVTPITVELGVLRRLAVQVAFAPTRTRFAVSPIANPDGTTGNAGFNPSYAGDATASQSNAAVQSAFTAARSDLAARIAAGSVSDAAAARALATEATQVQAALGTLYGTGTTQGRGAPVVPLAGSAEQRAVAARIAALSARFAAFGVGSLPATVTPAPATARIGATGLRTLLTDPAFGLQADSLRISERQGPGDIEALAALTWLDTFSADPRERFDLPSGFAVRSTAAIGWRLATIGEDLPISYVDIPTGSGAGAVLARVFADVAVGGRVLTSVAARFAQPTARTVAARIPEAPGDLFVAAYREREVTRTAGREWQLDVTPRVALGRQVALVGQLSQRQRAADRYTGTFDVPNAPTGIGAVTLDAAVLGVGTAQRETRVAYGVAYSTMAAWARRRTTLPVEVSYLRYTSVAGAGGDTPRATTDALTLRIYAPLFGPAARRR